MLAIPSIRNQIWQLPEHDARLIAGLQQQLNCSVFLAQLLLARGLAADTAPDFLNPTLRQLPDPLGLRDMDRAIAIIADAIIAQKTIGILGDYDVDGTCSTALWLRYLRQLRVACHFHIPNRFTEGYGPSALGLDQLLTRGADMILTVDCGISANDLLDEYAAKCPIVIIDHHIPGPELPRAAAIVNPNRIDCQFPHKNLAAVGVVFFTLIALNRELRQRGFFINRVEPDLKSLLDLVALGTVADIVTLIGPNRIFVKRGLEILAQRQNMGLAALADVAGLDGVPNAYHLGFVLGPRINAAGRLRDGSMGVELLTTTEAWQAQHLAQQLDQYNTERQAIEQSITAQAQAVIDAVANDNQVLVVANYQWHPGVIGIVASRLKEIYAKPVCVVALRDDGVGTGSARSVTGFHLGNAIITAQQSGILVKGGGHAMAAGFTVAAAQVPALQQFLNERFVVELGNAPPATILPIAASIHPRAVGAPLWAEMEQMEPFGAGNPQPKLAMMNLRVTHAEILKSLHLRLTLESADGTRVTAMAFRCMNAPLGQFLYQSRGHNIHVAGQFRPNDFNGRRTFQFLVEDAAQVG